MTKFRCSDSTTHH